MVKEKGGGATVLSVCKNYYNIYKNKEVNEMLIGQEHSELFLTC